MHLAILGATGAVGRTMLEVLAERRLPVERLTLLASPRSAGTTIRWQGEPVAVRAVDDAAFRGVDVALFSAGADRSREWARRAVGSGATVIDNSSAWRMDEQVPLVVPEVNVEALRDRPLGIVANPNCSTIQLVVALKALHDVAGLRRVVVTTFQAASGAGERGRDALRQELQGGRPLDSPFARPLAGNVVPSIGELDAEGWTAEERKMRLETRKILGLPRLAVAATCVRVPVDTGHSVQATVGVEAELDARVAADALAGFDGLRFERDPHRFATPIEVAGRDEVVVSRLRADPDEPGTLHLWIVADNLRKGAATNAVQIAEALIRG